MKAKSTYLVIGSIVGALVFAVPAFAQYGLQETAGAAGLTQYGGSVPVLVGNVIGAALSMVSVIFFALMIYGGIRYMTARGDEDATRKAVNTIWAAVIGILIVLASYAITNFVFQSLGSQTAPGTESGQQAGTLSCKPAPGASLATLCTTFSQQLNTCPDPYCQGTVDNCTAASGSSIESFCADVTDQSTCAASDYCQWST